MQCYVFAILKGFTDIKQENKALYSTLDQFSLNFVFKLLAFHDFKVNS